MKYPATLLIPIMMFADYFLTVAGAIQREKVHARHYKLQDYELNPLWQNAIRQKRWFNWRHTLLVIVVSGVLIGCLNYVDIPDWWANGLLGALLIVFGMVIGRHLSNLLLFGYLARNPDHISGEITMSHQLVVSNSLYQIMLTFIPLLLIAVFTRNDFAIGGLVGAVMLGIVHLRWRRKARLKLKKAAF